ncbi:hypothetical protein FRB90_012349, partial [Tulasnella sp. 427]
LARVFVRDLSKASQEPPVLTSSDEESLFDTEASSSDADTPKKKGVSAEQITYARDTFVLTQSAIRTIAVILSTKAIYSVFSETSLTCITSALLSILLAPKLYLPNARKTTMLAMWAVQNIRLPSSVISPLADRFLEAIQRGIDGQLGKEGKKGAGCESLNAIHTLCRLYPAVFIPHMPTFLTHILHRCVPAAQPATSANTNNMCLRATAALGGIALGVLNWTRLEPHDPDLKEAQTALTDCVAAFFAEPEGDEPTPTKMSSRKQQKSPKRLPDNTQAAAAPLIDAIVYAMSSSGDEGVDATSNPAWGISLLAALGVLFRESLFASPLGVALFLECLSKGGSKEAKGQTKLLLRMWWPSVIWAAGKLDQVEEARLLSLSASELRSQGGRKSVWSQSIWHLKFMGVATLTTLLNEDPESDEDREARIRVSMAWMRYAIKDNQAPAIHLLSQLVNTDWRREDGERCDWQPDAVIARQLLDGAIVTHDWKTLSALLKDVMENKVAAMVLEGELGDDEGLYGLPAVEDLRPLTEQEVRVWFEPMVLAWKDIVGRVSFGRSPAGEDGILGKAPTVVFTIWERLLRAQADFVQDPKSDARAVASVVGLITSVMTSFMIPHNDYPRSMEGSDQDRSLAALAFTRKLWDICKEVFGSFSSTFGLDEIPTSVIAALRNPADIQIHEFASDPVVAKLFEHWTNFLVDVLVVAPLKSLHTVCDDLMWEDPASRVLWSILARNVTSQEEWQDWHVVDGTCLLSVPFSEVCEEPISMDLSAMDTWEGLLDRVMQKAIVEESDPDAVLMSAAEMLNNCSGIDNATSLRVTAAIIRRIDFPQHASSYTPPVGKIEPEFDPQVLGQEITFILAVVNTPILRSLMTVSDAIEAPGLSYGSDLSTFQSQQVLSVLEDESQSLDASAEDLGYLADDSNLPAPVSSFIVETYAAVPEGAEVDAAGLALPLATIAQASPERHKSAIEVPASPSLAQLLERAALERTASSSSIESNASVATSDAGASESEISEVATPEPLVDYESSGPQESVAEAAAFDQFVDFSKEQDGESVAQTKESGSEIENTNVFDIAFIRDVERESSSEGAPSSDDVVPPSEPSASPIVEVPEVLVVATAPDSDDIEIPDSQADNGDSDTDEEDEADARFVDCSLELISPPTPTLGNRLGDVPTHSNSSLKRSVASLPSSSYKRARLEGQVASPLSNEYSTRVESPIPFKLPPHAATPSPSTGVPLRKRLFLDAVEVPSVASFQNRSRKAASNPKPVSATVQALKVSDDVFAAGPSGNAAPSRSPVKMASSLLGNAIPSLLERVMSQRSLSFGGKVSTPSPIFEQDIRSDDTEANVAVAREVLKTSGPSSDDVPSSFEGVIGSSGLKRQRPMEDRNEDENDTPTRRRISRTVSVPVPKHAEASSAGWPFIRTQSLSAEVQRSLQQVVGSPRQLNIADLQGLSAVLSNFKEEVDAAIVQKSKDGENGF